MAADLDVSLATVGFVGGTVFFAGLVVAKLGAARYTEAVGSVAGVRTCCLAGIAGNLIIAASPAIAGVAAGRLVTGVSLGLTLVARPGSGAPCRRGQARRRVRRGGHDRDGRGPRRRKLDAIGRARLAARFRPRGGDQPAGPTGTAGGGRREISAGSVFGLVRRSTRVLPAWRLELLFMTALGVPYVIGIWLIPYLTGDVAFSLGFAGVLAVVMFATSAVLRPEGARLEASGTSLALLGGVAPMIAGAGLALLAVSDIAPLAVAGVVLAGIGFAVPYGAMYDEAQRLFPTPGLPRSACSASAPTSYRPCCCPLSVPRSRMTMARSR